MSNIYVPSSSVKARETSFGQVIKIGANVEKLIAFLQENVNDRGFINLEIVPRREPSDKGETHSLKLDNWKPTQQAEGSPAPKAKPAAKAADPATTEKVAPDADEDIPF